MNRLLNRLIWIALVVLTPALSACRTNPATGRSQFNILSSSQELSIGAQASPQFLKEYGGELPDSQLVEYVRDLGQRLAQVSERATLPWAFHLVDSSVVNAFALPGGKVFVSRGLLESLNNEAELASVLGHEVGHVTAEHIGQQMSRAMVLQGVAVGVGLAANRSDSEWGQVLGAGVSVGGGVYLLKFGRDQETEADQLGLRYMSRLGYNPVAQIAVMKALKKASGGGAAPVEFLSTHPHPETRIKRLEKLIPKKYPDYQTPGVYRFNQDEYKQNVLDRLAKLPPARHGAKAKK